MKKKNFISSVVGSGIASGITTYLLVKIEHLLALHREIFLALVLWIIFFILLFLGISIYKKIKEFKELKDYVLYTSENLNTKEFPNLEAKILYLVDIKNSYKKE